MSGDLAEADSAGSPAAVESAGRPTPRLLRDRSGLQRVTNIELFFDLVYVFAVTQLSHYLLGHPTVAGALQAGLLLVMIWLLVVHHLGDELAGSGADGGPAAAAWCWRAGQPGHVGRRCRRAFERLGPDGSAPAYAGPCRSAGASSR